MDFLLILPFTGTAHLNDIFDLSYKAIFILFVWDYRQLFGLSWWKKFLPYNNHVLVLLFGTVASLFYHYRHHRIDSYIIQWGK